jgi:hypothetical protein
MSSVMRFPVFKTRICDQKRAEAPTRGLNAATSCPHALSAVELRVPDRALRMHGGECPFQVKPNDQRSRLTCD